MSIELQPEAERAGMRASGPRAAAVIVNFNGGDHLARAVDCVLDQSLPFDRVVVVDNASTDGSADSLPRAVEVIRPGRNLGFAAGNNLGVRAVEGCDWVALVNPDAFLADDWLARMLAAGEETGAAALGCLLVDDVHPDLLDGVGDVYHASGLAWRDLHGAPRSLAPRERVEIFAPCAAAALYRRDAFLAVGGFEERFFCYLEDVDLAFRLRLAGHACIYEPAVARHVGSALSGRESDFTIYHSHRNMVWTFVRDMPNPFRYLPQHLLMTVLVVAWFAMRGQGRTILRAKRDAVLGLSWALRERRRIQGSRLVDASLIRGHLVHGVGAYGNALSRARGVVWRSIATRDRAR